MTFVAVAGGASAFSSTSGGKVYGYNNISESTPRVVAPANPSRQKIKFINPGVSDIFIAPSVIQNVLGAVPSTPSDVTLTPSNAALGGCIPLYAGNTIELTGEVQGEWQAFAKTGAGTSCPLTIVDSNT